MRLWRIVLDASGEVWTVVVAAEEPFAAVALAQSALPGAQGASAALEELEALYDRSPLARPGIVRATSVRRVVRAPATVPRRPRAPRARRAAGR